MPKQKTLQPEYVNRSEAAQIYGKIAGNSGSTGNFDRFMQTYKEDWFIEGVLVKGIMYPDTANCYRYGRELFLKREAVVDASEWMRENKKTSPKQAA